MRSPCTATKSSPRSPQLEKAHVQQRRPNATKNKINNKNKYIKKKRRTTLGNLTGPDPRTAVWHSVQEAAGQVPSYYQGQWLARALLCHLAPWLSWAQCPLLPSTKASTANLQAATCHRLNVPPPTKPCVSLLFQTSKVMESITRSPCRPRIKRSLGLPCTHRPPDTPLPPSPSQLHCLLCVHIPSACWAVSARMFHEGREVCASVYNCTGFAWMGCLASIEVPSLWYHWRMKDPKVSKSNWDQRHLTSS